MVSSFVLFICGLCIKDIGDNYLCVNKNVIMLISGFFGFIDLGIVINMGKGKRWYFFKSLNMWFYLVFSYKILVFLEIWNF